MSDGYQMKHDQNMHIIAWHACLIRNVHLKKKDQKTPAQLLKKSQSPTDISTEIDKALAMLKERRESHVNNNSFPSDKNRSTS